MKLHTFYLKGVMMEIYNENKLMPLDELKLQLNMTLCSCLTKTPVLEYHETKCHYRVAHEALFHLNALLKATQ